LSVGLLAFSVSISEHRESALKLEEERPVHAQNSM
jgi:hypothetical protein